MRSKTLARAMAAAFATGAMLALSPAAALAQVPSSLTLAEAQARAESAHPALRAKEAQLAEAEGIRADAAAFLYNNPQLSTDLTRRRVPQINQGNERRTEWSAGLSQTLEIAGQRGFRREAAASSLSALRSEIDDARRSARSAAATQFYRVLALQQRVALEGQALKLFEGTAAAIQKRRAAGEDTRLDANIAAVEAERARNQEALAQEQLLAARTEFAAVLQLPPAELPTVSGELATLPPRALLVDLLQSVEAQPRLRALADRESSAGSRLKLEQASTYPDLTVGVSIGREGPGDARERLTTISVSVPLPLFKRNAGGIGQARSALTQAQLERETVRRDALAAVNGLWLRLESLNTRVRRLQDSMLPALADNEQLSRKSQQAGQIGLLELIVVNRQSLDAQRDLNDALAEYHATRFELDLAAGRTQDTNP